MADPRGNLALTFLALADRLRPEWIVWENVAGVLSSNGGRDFGAFLGALGKLGYGFAYRVLDAQYFGVAQRRRRVFVVANARDWSRAAAVLFEPESLQRHPQKSSAKGQGSASSTAPSSDTSCFWNGEQVTQTLDAVLAKRQTMPERNRFPAVLVPPVVIDRAAFNQGVGAQYAPRIEASETMSSLVARDPHAVSAPPSFAVRRLTPVECERLQGFPDDWTSVPHRGKPAADGPRYKAIGNSMAVPVMRWIGERIAAVDEVTR
jgi:DNA (cytosine-5)-methyltransferase 1